MRLMPRLFSLSLLPLLATVISCVTPSHPSPGPSIRTSPMLRIETGMHRERIEQIGVDASNRFLVTATYDMTVRVWELSTGRLISALRPPIEEEGKDKLYAVAISPDGETIVTGGWSAAFYVFDRATGQIRQRIDGLPGSVFHLSFSQDGQYLAANVAYNAGVCIFRINEKRKLSSIGCGKGYGVQNNGADWDSSGRLATISDDGHVRLYDSSFRLIVKKRVPGGARPQSIHFSPDGSELAVAFADSSNVIILSGSDLDLLFAPDLPKTVDRNAHLRVRWSKDGQTLFGGTYIASDDLRVAVVAWGHKGRGRPEELVLDLSHHMHDFAPLSDGGLAFGTIVGSIGIMHKDGSLRYVVGESYFRSEMADRDSFHISSDGTTVQFSYDEVGKSQAQFNARGPTLHHKEYSGLAVATPLFSPRTHVPGGTVEWKGLSQALLNGKPLQLKQDETLLTLAFAADGTRFVLATSFHLRCYDLAGKELWRVTPGAVVWAVNISQGGDRVVSLSWDGTIRWYRLRDGMELLTLFPHADRKRWILWTPQGYFDASPGAEELIGWRVNQGIDKAAEFYPAAQFFDQYYRPDLIQEVLQAAETDKEVLARWKESERVVVAQGFKLPPKVTFLAPSGGRGSDIPDQEILASKDDLEVVVQAVEQGGGVEEIRLYQNGKAVGVGTRGITVVRDNAQPGATTKRFQVRLLEGRNVFRAVALSRDKIESRPVEMTVVLRASQQKPSLHLFLVGINSYRNPALNLNYALPDAQGLREFFVGAGGSHFQKIQRYELYDQAATRAAIRAKLQELEASAPQDVVLLYFAGHGESLGGTWYFVPYELTTPERDEVLKKQALSSDELEEQLAKLNAQKVLVLIDACKSGSAVEAFVGKDRRAVAQLARGAGVHVVAGSTKDQQAVEVKELGHGLFTYTVLQGLRGGADGGAKKNGIVSVRELLAYVESQLPEFSAQYKSAAQSPVINSSGMDFPLAAVR